VAGSGGRFSLGIRPCAPIKEVLSAAARRQDTVTAAVNPAATRTWKAWAGVDIGNRLGMLVVS
jgi:hypothetical protein